MIMKKKIKYLDGIRLHRAISAGVNSLVSEQDYLNKINVFPVPDGDTGTNMAFTMTAIIDGLEGLEYKRIDSLCEIIAESVLDGCRGNSGAILAQFFQGFYIGVKGHDRLSPSQFSKAINEGFNYAYEAISEPVEGTILTVIKDFSEIVNNCIEDGVEDFIIILDKGYEVAQKSLDNTPNLMAVLKKAGVVDAGAKGFVSLLYGINEYINKGSLENKVLIPKIIDKEKTNKEVKIDELTYRYCIECIVTSDFINQQKLRERLANIGDSIVLAGSKIKSKVHIHANNPSEVFSVCEEFGEVLNQKADDMTQQQESAHGKENSKIAIVTDSAADFNNDDFNIHVVPVRYNFGNKDYIDKVSQTTTEFYNELLSNPEHPKTSQPVPGDFIRKYQYLKSHYESIISLHIPHSISGTIQSAYTAIKGVSDLNISVIDSNNISVGLGLLVTYASELVEKGKSHSEIVSLVQKAKESTTIYAAIKDLSYAVKGGRVPKSKKIIVDLFNLRPVLTTATNGSLTSAGVLFGSKRFTEKIANFAYKKHKTSIVSRIAVGHCNSKKEGQKLVHLLTKKFPDVNSITLYEVGCALGVHAGPGTLVVGLQEANTEN